jgi:hypothetical protein
LTDAAKASVGGGENAVYQASKLQKKKIIIIKKERKEKRGMEEFVAEPR